MDISQLLLESKTNGTYRIVKGSASSWIGVKVKISEPTTFNIEPFRAVIVVDAPKGSPAERYVGRALPLLGGVVTATFEEII